MNIGDNTQVGAAGEDLFERMRAVHAEAADAAGDATGADEVAAAKTTGPAASEPAAQADAPGEAGPVQQRLMEAARHVLSGDFDRPAEVRRTVVDTIVEERWSHVVDPESDSGLVETLRNSLTEDLAFRAEVDNMLLHAARRLGASGQ